MFYFQVKLYYTDCYEIMNKCFKVTDENHRRHNGRIKLQLSSVSHFNRDVMDMYNRLLQLPRVCTRYKFPQETNLHPDRSKENITRFIYRTYSCE